MTLHLGGNMFWSAIWVACTGSNSSTMNASPSKPSVLFLVSDTTRADAFNKADTPNLDALAKSEKGQSIALAIAPSSWTSPSVLSMFTGKSVREHGWDYPIAQVMIRHKIEYPAISDDEQMLAEILKDAGYQTHGYFANRFLIRDLGFSRGFDEWEFMSDDALPARTVSALSEVDSSDPHFFYVHFFGPHQPLKPTADRLIKYNIDETTLNDGGMGFRQIKKRNATTAQYKVLYDAIIEDTDARMGLVIDAFLQKFPDGRIVMTSDHGEMIGEHGELGHKDGLYQELIHVPLIVYGDRTQSIGELFSLTSIADWTTDSVGVKATWNAQWDDYALTAEDALVVAQRDGDVAIIRHDKKKLVLDYPMTIQNGSFFQGKSNSYVFNLSTDPKELRPIESAELETALTQQLNRWQEQREPGIADGQTSQTNRAFINDLRKLGYVSDGK